MKTKLYTEENTSVTKNNGKKEKKENPYKTMENAEKERLKKLELVQKNGQNSKRNDFMQAFLFLQDDEPIKTVSKKTTKRNRKTHEKQTKKVMPIKLKLYKTKKGLQYEIVKEDKKAKRH